MNLLNQYKIAFTELIADRVLRGPLSNDEEMRRAGEHAILWHRLSDEEQVELESWLELQMKKNRRPIQELG